MIPYANLGGDSGIVAYEIAPNQFPHRSITVQFASGKHTHYEYTDTSAGPEVITLMLALAAQGRGLNSYISRTKPGYARKW